MIRKGIVSHKVLGVSGHEDGLLVDLAADLVDLFGVRPASGAGAVGGWLRWIWVHPDCRLLKTFSVQDPRKIGKVTPVLSNELAAGDVTKSSLVGRNGLGSSSRSAVDFDGAIGAAPSPAASFLIPRYAANNLHSIPRSDSCDNLSTKHIPGKNMSLR